MSLRLEMLQVARLAPTVLGDEASDLVENFVRSQQNEDGGFRDRDGESDLYYTSFAIDVLTALQVPLPEDSLRAFLESRTNSLDELDFVHLCCLARCASAGSGLGTGRHPEREACLAPGHRQATPVGRDR